MGNALKPLSVFAAQDLQGAFGKATLSRLTGHMEDERSRIAEYLRRGVVVLAWMEQTDDVIDGRFTVAGGSAILTDGAYFWRLDTADYVEAYGVRLPEEFELRPEASFSAANAAEYFHELTSFYESGRGGLEQLVVELGDF